MIKKPQPMFHATVSKGKFLIKDKKTFMDYVLSLASPDKEETPVTITVKKFYRNRTDQQNKYYWGVVIPIFQQLCGYETAAEMHAALSYEHLRIKKGPLYTVKSTRKMTTVEWEDYMTLLRMWASKEFQAYIPLPNEVDFDEIDLPFIIQ